MKVQAELLYPRMQQAYDQILDLVNAEYDYSQRLLNEINWLKARQAQARYLLAGSEEVVQLYNSIRRIMDTPPQNEEELRKQDQEITKSRKKLWNVMRADLYHLKKLPQDALRFYGPGARTLRALEIWGRNIVALERAGIFDLGGLNDMDVSAISQSTAIPRADLEELRMMAGRESRLRREFEAGG